MFDLGKPDEIPPIPKYIQEWESPFDTFPAERNEVQSKPQPGRPSTTPPTNGDSARGGYPLQAIGHHTLHRVHSTHDNNDWLEEAFPQRVFINPVDAEARGIKDGDEVKVYNQRGALILPCRVTPRIMPGVIDIPQGAWYEPDANGVDRGGCVNVLTSHQWTPYAYASTQQTIMVEVERTMVHRREAK